MPLIQRLYTYAILMAFECRQLPVTPYDLAWKYMCQIGGFGIKITKNEQNQRFRHPQTASAVDLF